MAEQLTQQQALFYLFRPEEKGNSRPDFHTAQVCCGLGIQPWQPRTYVGEATVTHLAQLTHLKTCP